MRALLVLVVLGIAAPAHAQRTLAKEAQAHLDAGLAAYGKGDYPAAIRELEAAHALDPDPRLLYALAQALRLGDKCERAVVIYRKYLTSGLNEAQTAAANGGIALCEEHLKSRPAPEPAPVPPPEPEPVPESLPPPVPVEAPPGTRPWYTDPIGGVLTGVGVAGIGVGIGFVVASNRSRDRLADIPNESAFDEELATANQRRRIGIAALAAGGALVVGGVAVYLFRDRGERGPRLATDGQSILVSGEF